MIPIVVTVLVATAFLVGLLLGQQWTRRSRILERELAIRHWRQAEIIRALQRAQQYPDSDGHG